jgi:hypothetical protein
MAGSSTVEESDEARKAEWFRSGIMSGGRRRFSARAMRSWMKIERKARLQETDPP